MKLTRKYLYQNRLAISVLICLDFLLSYVPRKKNPIPEFVEKILILKPDHLGDMLLATAVFPLIREKYPGAVIDVICQKGTSSILNKNQHIRNLYWIEHFLLDHSKKTFFKAIRFLKSYFSLLRVCRKNRYDLCLLFRAYGGNLITFGRLIRPKCLIGHATAGFGGLLDIAVDWEKGLHEIGHFLEVLEPLGIHASFSHLRGEVHPSGEDRAFVEQLCQEKGLKEFIAIHPFARDSRKMFDANLWISLIEKSAYPVVICGKLGEKIEGLNGIDLIGKFTLPQLYVLIEKAIKIYTLDSLSGHLAALTGRPTTVFYHAHLFSEQWRPVGNEVEISLHRF